MAVDSRNELVILFVKTQRQNHHPLDHHLMHTIHAHVRMQKILAHLKVKPWKLSWGSPKIEAHIYTNTVLKIHTRTMFHSKHNKCIPVSSLDL